MYRQTSSSVHYKPFLYKYHLLYRSANYLLIHLYALDFEHGDFSDDAGPWAGCGETPPELAEEHMHELHEFYDYDGDLGLDDFG